jgi:hypothetical protein
MRLVLTYYAAKLKGLFELYISKMDFINDCLVQKGSFCGGIYQIIVSLNGKYTRYNVFVILEKGVAIPSRVVVHINKILCISIKYYTFRYCVQRKTN